MPRPRIFRRRRAKTKRQPPRGAPTIVAEGDSWLDYPPQLDVVDYLARRFKVHSKAHFGDELSAMVAQGEWLPLLERHDARCLLLSGGGNDILGPTVLPTLLRQRNGARSRHELLERPLFQRQLEQIERLLDRAVRKTHAAKPGLPILLHGYAYVVPSDRPPRIFFLFPVQDKAWIKPVLEAKNILAPGEQRFVIKQMIDGFNGMLQDFAASHDDVHYVDCRPLVTDDDWADEIHPRSRGFKRIAERCQAIVEAA